MGAIHSFSALTPLYLIALFVLHPCTARLSNTPSGVRLRHIEENKNWEQVLFIWVAKIRSNSYIRSDELVINVVMCLPYLLGSRSTCCKWKKFQVLGLSPLSWCPDCGGQLWQTIRTLTVSQGDSVSSPVQNCRVFVRKWKKNNITLHYHTNWYRTWQFLRGKCCGVCCLFKASRYIFLQD